MVPARGVTNRHRNVHMHRLHTGINTVTDKYKDRDRDT